VRYAGESGWVDVGRVETGRGLAFFVRDTGPGFESRYAGRIFEPFQRLDLSDDSRLGVGLAILEQVALLHRGEAWATSEPGNGATVYFTLGDGSRPWLLTELTSGPPEAS